MDLRCSVTARLIPAVHDGAGLSRFQRRNVAEPNRPEPRVSYE